jgi:beta-RFAP synthase
MQTSPERLVAVETTARLHMGFVDLHGGLGRRFGSIGLSLDRPSTRFTATLAQNFSATGCGAQRLVEVAEHFAQRANLSGGAHFDIASVIPEHAGLGSGTQLALAVGMALSHLHGLGLSVDEVAVLAGRGMRSGIGIGAFKQGGLLVDGGRGRDTQVPPIVARMDFPAAWRILLVYDPHSQGVHGKQEVRAFGELPEFPSAQAAHIARLLLVQALPAMAEQDLESFGRAISELQRIVGDHFAPAQGGGRYISPEVGEAMAWLESRDVHCTGQSSWGPTGFAVVAGETQAGQLLPQLEHRNPRLKYEICSARNQGSLITDDCRSGQMARAVLNF